MYPDFIATETSPEALAEALDSFGCFLLRQAFSQEMLEPFLNMAHEAYRQADAELERGEMPEALLRKLRDYGHVPLRYCDRIAEPQQAVIQMVCRSALAPLLRHLWGEHVAFFKADSMFRRQATSSLNPPVPFHQDGVFMKEKPLSLNCWTPLMNCGQDAPGLEMITQRQEKLWRADTLQQMGSFYPTYDNVELNETDLHQQFTPELFWKPSLQVGDVLVFDNLTIHRTHQLPQMMGERISLEIRCTRVQHVSRFPGGFLVAELTSGFCEPIGRLLH